MLVRVLIDLYLKTTAWGTLLNQKLKLLLQNYALESYSSKIGVIMCLNPNLMWKWMNTSLFFSIWNQQYINISELETLETSLPRPSFVFCFLNYNENEDEVRKRRRKGHTQRYRIIMLFEQTELLLLHYSLPLLLLHPHQCQWILAFPWMQSNIQRFMMSH